MRARIPIALAAGLALADASVVTLALPPIAAELGVSVRGLAAVLGVYALALAFALPAAVALRRAAAARVLGAGGLALFAAASAGAGAAGSLGALLAWRAVQAAGGALALVAAFEVLDGAGRGRRLWTAAAVFGTAAGPALGGALTQALDWRAVFIAQIPVALAGAAAFAWGRAQSPAASAASPPTAGTASPPAVGTAWPPPDAASPLPSAAAPTAASPGAAAALWCALALVAAALTGVLFLLVLLLVTGWSMTPLGAAVVVSIVPVAALAGARVGGPARARACAGAAMLGGGVLALAAVPGAEAAWTLLPQALAGVGMGLALPALAGELLPERSPVQAARLLAARHLGIVAALAVLAPLAAHQLDRAVADTRERGAALVLDAKLPPLDKLRLVNRVAGRIDPVDPRGEVRSSLERALAGVGDQHVARRLIARADDAVVEGVDGAFRPALLVCGGLGVLSALLLALPTGGAEAGWGRAPGRARGAALAAAAVALLLAGAALLARPQLAPQQVAIANPCRPRALPHTGGIDGALQDIALAALDRAACRWGSSREELALALVDDHAARAYRREHHVDPRDAIGLAAAALGL